MGSVWRATDRVLDREVAIKMVSDEASMRRFRREAVVLARLTHPQVARLYDYCESGGTAFLVMEYLAGPSLATVPPLAPPRAAEVVAETAEGLHAVHQAGIVHRDIKPANIIITTRGACLVDFGLATGSGDDRVTETGSIAGSAPYLAPERAAGYPASVASDIYALGIVLYEVLTGRPPFASGDPMRTIDAHLHAPVPPLPWQVPEPLALACLSALSKDPRQRPASALEFARQLRSAAPVSQTAVYNQTAVYTPDAFGAASGGSAGAYNLKSRRWPLAAAAAAGAAIAIVAVAVLYHPGSSSVTSGATTQHTAAKDSTPAVRSSQTATPAAVPGASASFTATLNSTGISSSSDPSAANFDGLGFSFQEQALAAAGYSPGAQVSVDGITFSWPSGAPDNTVAMGQTFMITGTGAELAFLGASAYGTPHGIGGTATIHYTDGSIQSFQLVIDDWDQSTATAGLDQVAVTTNVADNPSGPAQRPSTVYFESVALEPGKTVEAVTLPVTAMPAANVSSLHIFAVSIG
jgi:serine/threonine protein kinase